MRPPSANLLITRGEWRSINSDGGVGRDSLSLLCGRRRVSGAGKFTGRHKTMWRFGTLLHSPNSIAPRPNRRNALRSTPAFRRRSCTLLAGDFVESPEGREVCPPVFSQLVSSQQPGLCARLLFFARISPQRSQAPGSQNAQVFPLFP